MNNNFTLMVEVFGTLQAESTTLAAAKTHSPTLMQSADRLTYRSDVGWCARGQIVLRLYFIRLYEYVRR